MTEYNIVPAVDPKPWWQSRTIIGAGVATASTIAGIAGYGVPVEVQGQVVDIFATLGTLVGAGLSVWGRLKASRPIGA